MRAYDPWPGIFTTWRSRTLKVLEASVLEGAVGRRRPGTVFRDGDGLAVATGDGALDLHRVQLQGRRGVGARDFLNGHPEVVGEVLPS